MGKSLGKIDSEFFKSVIQQKLGHPRSEVSVPARFGVDTSVVDLPGRQAMMLTSDPLSLIPSLGLRESAWLSVHLMANDMATTGFGPQYGQFVLNLPADFPQEDFKIYWEHIHNICDDAGIAITGGHTGFVEGQNSTIAGAGTLVSVAPRDQVLVSSDARSGDEILVTKGAALSSTSILAMSFPQTVRDQLGEEVYRQVQQAFYLTSSLEDALVAVGERGEDNEVTAMHDVTEGGVLGAIYELAVASDNGAQVRDELIPIGDAQQQVSDLFELDPRYIIGAGSMIITCRKGTAPVVIGRLNKAGISCAKVGELKDKDNGIKLERDGILDPMPYYESDPHWAAFYKALKSNWK